MTREETNRLQAYFDGQLPADERAAIEAWLEQSEEARKELEAMQAVRRQLQSDVPEIPDPDEEWESVREQIEFPPQRTKTIPFPQIIGAVAAILVFALVLRSSFFPNTLEETATMVMVETEIEDASAIVYVDEESGWTVVWVDEGANDTLEPLDGSA